MEVYILITNDKNEVAIGPVTGHVSQSYRSGNHVNHIYYCIYAWTKCISTCAVLQTTDRKAIKWWKHLFLFILIRFYLCAHSYIIEIHGAAKVIMKYNYCLNREKFRWLFLHVQMIAGVGLLVVVHPFQETKVVGYLFYSVHSS